MGTLGKYAGWILALAVVSITSAIARNVQRGFARDLSDMRALNDSTVAMLARTRVDNQELKSIVEAADELNGKLVAAVRILVARRDTVVIHDTLPTTVLPDSTRTATFRDSTFAGVITGTVTAPPCCGALGVSYHLDRPAFSPSVGFVEKGGEVAAIVTWQGERVELKAPFAKIPRAEPRLRPYVSGGVSTTLTLRAEAGTELRVGSWYGFASIQQDVPTDRSALYGPQAWIGVRKRW